MKGDGGVEGIVNKKAEPKLRQKTPAEVVLAYCLEPFVTR